MDLSRSADWLAVLFGREVALGRTPEVEVNAGVGSGVTATSPSVYRCGMRRWRWDRLLVALALGMMIRMLKPTKQHTK